MEQRMELRASHVARQTQLPPSSNDIFKLYFCKFCYLKRGEIWMKDKSTNIHSFQLTPGEKWRGNAHCPSLMAEWHFRRGFNTLTPLHLKVRQQHCIFLSPFSQIIPANSYNWLPNNSLLHTSRSLTSTARVYKINGCSRHCHQESTSPVHLSKEPPACCPSERDRLGQLQGDQGRWAVRFQFCSTCFKFPCKAHRLEPVNLRNPVLAPRLPAGGLVNEVIQFSGLTKAPSPQLQISGNYLLQCKATLVGPRSAISLAMKFP